MTETAIKTYDYITFQYDPENKAWGFSDVSVCDDVTGKPGLDDMFDDLDVSYNLVVLSETEFHIVLETESHSKTFFMAIKMMLDMFTRPDQVREVLNSHLVVDKVDSEEGGE